LITFNFPNPAAPEFGVGSSGYTLEAGVQMATYKVTIQAQTIEVDANSEAEAKTKGIKLCLKSASPMVA